MAGDLFQVLSDCPDCRVVGAVIELIDPARAAGTAVDAHCRLCGRLEQMGTLVQVGQSMKEPSLARAALAAWAEREGEADAESFCCHNLGGLSLAEVVRKLCDGEVIDSSFDAVAYLFPGMSGAAGAPAFDSRGAEETTYETLPTVDDGPDLAPTISLGQGPAIAARALVAVMWADGEVRPGERAFVDAFLAKAGLEPLSDADLRHWRPVDLGIPEEPGLIIDAMVELAYVDRVRDGAEWQVIREFARHWAQDLVALEARRGVLDRDLSSGMRRLWQKLRSIFMMEHK